VFVKASVFVTHDIKDASLPWNLSICVHFESVMVYS